MNGKYEIRFEILQEIQNSKVHFSLIAFNTLQMVINQGYMILQNSQVFMSGFTEDFVMLPFTEKNESAFFSGLKSITLEKSIRYSAYNFYLNNYPSIVYSFSNLSRYDEIELFWISQTSCSSPMETFDRVGLKCVQNRSNCSSYYQKVTVPVTSFIY